MSYATDRQGTSQGTILSGPPASAFEGVRTRRIFALLIDLIVVTCLWLVIVTALGVLGVVTFGLAWMLIPPLFPAIALVYNGASISGARMATLGMRSMDLEMRLSDGTPVPFLNAAAHAVFYYLSIYFLTPLVLLVALFTREKRCLHDLAAGVVVTRRL